MSVALMGHTFGDQTLTQTVRRVAESSLTEFDSGTLSINRFAPPVIEPTKPEELIDQFTQRLLEIIGQGSEGRPVALSLSAGYDSRLLLSVLLSLGIKPDLATMGHKESTDYWVAERIARDFGLTHRRIELSPEDYIESAPGIARLTGGTKTADHWHTYLFAKKSGFDSASIHWAGSNGEYLRSYYFDKGILSLLSSSLPARLASVFLGLKNSPSRRLPKIAKAGLFADKSLAVRTLALLNNRMPKKGGWLHALDEFYAHDRVRHFIGNGLAMYNQFTQTYSPFLDGRLLAISAQIPRKWKLNSRLHRWAIGKLMPRLLDYPVSESPLTMGELDTSAYWLSTPSFQGYSVFDQVCSLPTFVETIIESIHLDQFLDQDSRASLLESRQLGVLGYLFALHHVAELAKAHNAEVSISSGT